MLELFKNPSFDENLRIQFSTATADLGNNRGKFIFNGTRYRDLPNVIATCADDANGLAPSKGKIWDWLKVKITSPALQKDWAPVAIGNAAYSYDTSYVAHQFGNKYHDDNQVLMLLAAVAADAIENGLAYEDARGFYHIKTFLSTFLPMREYKEKDYRDHFVKKLMKGTHKVQFLNTIPSHKDKVIYIKFMDDHVELNPEGLGNHIRLKFTVDGEDRNLSQTDKTYVTFDLGGGTGDEAYMKDGETCDPKLSRGHDIGINSLLDDIRNAIENDNEFRGFRFHNRDDVNAILLKGTNKGEELRYSIEWHGVEEDVTHHVVKLTKEFVEFQLFPVIERILERAEIKALYMVGGTSVLLKKYIEERNELRKRRLPIHFVDEHTAYWGLVEAGDMLGFEYRLENDLLLPEESDDNEEI